MSTPRGSILIEVLIVIAIAVFVMSVLGEVTYIGMRGTKFSGDSETAMSLLYETFEAVENISGERWWNIYNLNKDGSPYHPGLTGGAWIVESGVEDVILGDIVYARSFTVQNVCRDPVTRDVTGVTDGGGALGSCALSGGAFDPSTQKITSSVSVPESDSVSDSVYIARWRNKVCEQTSWTASGSTGAQTCPATVYESSSNITGGAGLELCQGGC